MVSVPLSRVLPSRAEEIEDWPWLDLAELRASRSRQVCMTCHFFRHHARLLVEDEDPQGTAVVAVLLSPDGRVVAFTLAPG